MPADTLDLARDCHTAYLQANDATRRLFNQAFFTKIYIDEDDDTRERTVRVDYNQPFDGLLSRLVPARVHHELQSKGTSEPSQPVDTGPATQNARQDSLAGNTAPATGVTQGQGSHTGTMVDLRREFENPCSALKTVASRWSRGVYKRSRRPSEPTVVDSRGRMVRAVGLTQTFLRPAQVDELVALYREGATLVELGKRFSVHRRTAAAHLVRRSVPIRRRGLDGAAVAEAVNLYEGGLTLMEVGLRFGVSQQAVRRALDAEGVTIRPSGRRARVSA